MSYTDDRPRYQAFVVGATCDHGAEPRYSQREARADADGMHQDRNGEYRVVVIDNNHRAAGSLESVVYDLPANA